MRLSWVVMLVIAVSFGALSVFVANRWLAMQQTARVLPAEGVETATIVVAATDLPFGKQLGPQDLRQVPWPTKNIPEGYFATISEVTGAGGRVVLSPLGPNEPVLKWKISGPDQRGSLSAIVEPGMRAVSVRVNELVGVGGFVLPGDRVDLLLTRDVSGSQVTDVLLQNVKVLAIDQQASEKVSEPTVGKVATLEVTSPDAQKIALAQTVGSLTLSLRSAGSLDEAPARRIVTAELTSSSSVYDEQLAARRAAELALNTRIKSLEKNIADLGKVVEKTGSQTEEAMRLREQELKARIAELQAEFDKRVQASGDEAAEALKQQIAAIQKELEDKLKASGKDDAKLRERLTQLQEALRQALLASSEGNDALRLKLLALESKLGELTGKPQATIIPVAERSIPFVVDETFTVNVIRNMKAQSYTVPRELTAN